MSQAPSTVVQLALLLIVVLPGMTYQFLRERWRGQVPGERDLGQRVLRATIASIVLDTTYVIVAGPALLRLLQGPGGNGWQGLTRNLRLVGIVGMLLLVVIPAIAAAAVSWLERRHRAARYSPTPTAWDHAFRNRESCFIRARLKDGTWVGGWYGTQSYVASYPDSGDIFLESAWNMAQNGSFASRPQQRIGLYVSAESTDIVEFLERPPRQDPEGDQP